MSELMHKELRAGHLASLAIGGDFTLTGRLGAPPGRESKILLLSAGIGVTPMVGALRWLRQREAKRCAGPNRYVRANVHCVCFMFSSCFWYLVLASYGCLCTCK